MVEAREFESEMKKSCVVLDSQEGHVLSFCFKNKLRHTVLER